MSDVYKSCDGKTILQKCACAEEMQAIQKDILKETVDISANTSCCCEHQHVNENNEFVSNLTKTEGTCNCKATSYGSSKKDGKEHRSEEEETCSCCSIEMDETSSCSLASSHSNTKREKEDCRETEGEICSCCLIERGETSNCSLTSHNTKRECEASYSEEGEICSCCSVPHNDTESEIKGCCSAPTKNKKKSKSILLLAVSIIAVILSYIFSRFDIYSKLGSHKLAVLDPAWIAIVISGTPIFKAALYNLKRKKITSALLVTMAIVASIIIGFIVIFGETNAVQGHNHGFFFAAGEVAVIMAIGGVLEDLTLSKSRSAIENLIKMRPTVALRKEENGGFREVEIEDIVVGDVVLVRPNEIISVDGIIVHGETAIDTSNITGEFLAKDSYIGDQVYSGTKNLSGAIEVKVTTPSNETTISKLIRYVKEASKKKAPVVKVADKMASYLVIGALLISIVVFFTSLFGFKLSPLESVQRAATILVVFCPCALALATPVAIAAGIGNASKNGILIKSGLALEKITKIDTIAFDKTGTITEGKINVEKVYPYEISEKELIIYAASAENKSEHPIAKAILKYNNYDILESTKTVSLLGIGVEAKIGDKKVGVYKIDHVKDLIPIIEYEKIEKLGHTVVSVLLDGKYIGSITLSDTLRADAEWTIKELKDMNKECVMLTGDNLESALMIAEKVGIDNVKANLLPEDKVSIIEELKRDNKKALMVGDGVNDAAALAVADSSIAIAAMESSVAMETAEISLMTKNIKKIPYLFSLSKRTLLTIKINITLSLLISITSIILSALGLINIVAGALIHNASSVLVTLHSALLLMYKRKSHLA